jgi:hypothetical protein
MRVTLRDDSTVKLARVAEANRRIRASQPIARSAPHRTATPPLSTPSPPTFNVGPTTPAAGNTAERLWDIFERHSRPKPPQRVKNQPKTIKLAMLANLDSHFWAPKGSFPTKK